MYIYIYIYNPFCERDLDVMFLPRHAPNINHAWQQAELSRCRTDMAHIRQSRPDYGRGANPTRDRCETEGRHMQDPVY